MLLLLAQALGVPVVETSVTWTEIPGVPTAWQHLANVGSFTAPRAVSIVSWTKSADPKGHSPLVQTFFITWLLCCVYAFQHRFMAFHVWRLPGSA